MTRTDFIKTALEESAKIAADNFGKVSGTTKEGDNNQVLTETDIAIGKLLVGKVQETFPEHNIIDEEAGVINKNSNCTWVIDPIDGTSNFAAGLPTYGVMIGLLEDNQPVAGGVVLPAFNEFYIAEKGTGAFCNGQQIYVTKETDPLKTLVAYGIDGHQENPQMTYDECNTLAQIVLSIRNLRTSNSAFDTMQVARGRYSAMLNKTSKIWDNVANHIIIEEAGGKYTDYDGKAIDYSDAITNSDKNYTLCTGAPAIFEVLQKTIHK